MRPPGLPVSRRTKVLVPTFILLLVVLSLLGSAVSLVADYLWFRSVDFGVVFTTVLTTKIELFFLFGGLLAATVAVNLFLAHRLRPPFRPASLEQQNLDRYRLALEPRLPWVLVGVSALFGILAGLAAAADWQTWLLWLNGTSFGTTDAQFGKDVSYFAFTYPFQRMVMGYLFTALVLSIMGAAFTHYLFGGIRLQTPGDRLTPAAKVHLSVLAGLFVALKAVAYWLDRYGLAFSPRGVVTGPSYTDVNAVLIAKTILVFVAAICAVLFFASVVTRSLRLPAAGLGLLVLAAIVMGGIYPAAVQYFQVRPNEISKEAPYIARNIDATREAYGISSTQDGGPVDTTNFDATTDPAQVDTQAITGGTDAGTADAAGSPLRTRLLDPNKLSPTFQQLQQFRRYYTFAPSLDIDRYDFGNGLTEAVVGVRELNVGGLPTNNRNWINDHLLYTHGHGFVAAPADQVDSDGAPTFTVGDLPVTKPAGFELDQSRIYFGENMQAYSVVDTAQGEIDGPAAAGSDEQALFSYDGNGGVRLGNPMTKVLYALKYREKNLLLSNALTDDSRIMYVRNPRERVAKVAPYLKLDGDPYPAVVQGRVIWIIDGYTTSPGYPYSQLTTLGDLTADALTSTANRSRLPQEQVNYIRNSVKATVDAYSGDVTLYQFDESDPVLATWMKAFPNTVEPKSAISDELRQHFRYPEDLFKVQRDLLSKYHVTDPGGFYNGEDFWQVPADPTSSAGDQPPYYLYLRVPGSPQSSLDLTTVFNAADRPNLAAFMSASSDPEDYGTLRVLRLPRDTNVPGPGQQSGQFNSNANVASTLALLERGSSSVIRGNLLTLPVGGGLLYVQPVYVQSTQGEQYPLLRKVIVGFGNQVALEDSLSGALNVIFSGAAATPPPEEGTGSPSPTSSPSPGASPSATPSNAPADLAAALAEIDAAFAAQQQALAQGDFTAAGQAQDRLARAIAAARALQSDSGTGTATNGSATNGSAAGPTPSPSGS